MSRSGRLFLQDMLECARKVFATRHILPASSSSPASWNTLSGCVCPHPLCPPP
jgi:hypothetical protein